MDEIQAYAEKVKTVDEVRELILELKEFVSTRSYVCNIYESLPEQIDDTIEMLEAREGQLIKEILSLADELTRG